MASNAGYNIAKVEQVLLEAAIRLHPEKLTAGELQMKIIADPNDDLEVETAIRATRRLKEFDLFCDRNDEIVEPTYVALHVGKLLMQ